MQYFTMIFAVFFLAVAAAGPAQAGLDLENQTQLVLGDLDLDSDGRIQRTEMAKYMFFYFDRDGNESLTKGEFNADREITVVPEAGETVSFVDLNNDGTNDEAYTPESFLETVMTGEYDVAAGVIEAREFVGVTFLKLDRDKSRAIELDEWQKAYEKGAVNKPNQAPKAADQDRYGR